MGEGFHIELASKGHCVHEAQQMDDCEVTASGWLYGLTEFQDAQPWAAAVGPETEAELRYAFGDR